MSRATRASESYSSYTRTLDRGPFFGFEPEYFARLGCRESLAEVKVDVQRTTRMCVEMDLESTHHVDATHRSAE